jgi:hypothetical protein
VTLRESYDRFFAQYGGMVEPNSEMDALMRGAFAAGLQHGLMFAVQLDPAEIAAALERTNHEIDGLWERRNVSPGT